MSLMMAASEDSIVNFMNACHFCCGYSRFGGSADLVLQFNEISIRNLHQAGPGKLPFSIMHVSGIRLMFE